MKIKCLADNDESFLVKSCLAIRTFIKQFLLRNICKYKMVKCVKNLHNLKHFLCGFITGVALKKDLWIGVTQRKTVFQ